MSTIVVVGGTGYTGGNIAREAVSRGHHVVSVSRSAPKEPIPGVQYETGPIEEVAPRVVPGVDAVVATLSPRGDMAGRLVSVYRDLAQQSAATGARYIQIGGFSSLRPAAGQPRFVEGDVPEEFRAEAQEGDATRAMLGDSAPEGLDWVFVSPAGGYGSWAAGEPTGSFRVGDDVALFDDNGGSNISGADFAAAVVDEIDNPTHHRAHIGVAY
jgi:putative NADH-flavin reductase